MREDLTREDLIELVELIMDTHGGESEEEADRLVQLFEANVPHPGATDLVFWWDRDFGQEPTVEEIVDCALAYKPIQLGPGE